jgi:hypothetical protein
MNDALSTIAALTRGGYRLTLYRSASGRCWADLRRGWVLRKRVRVDLDRDGFEQAKLMLGAGMRRKRVRGTRLARLGSAW